MYGQQPWFRNYPSNVSYNPNGTSFQQVPTRALSDEQIAEERRRVLAERRARRAQWLPDEVYDGDEDYDRGFSPFRRQESPYAELKRRQELAEQERRQEALKKLQAIEALRRQEEQRRHEALSRKQREAALKQEEEERQQAAEQDKHLQQQAWGQSRSRGGRQGDTSIPIHIHHDTQSLAPKSPTSSRSTSGSPTPSEPSVTQPQSHPSSPKYRKPGPTLEEQNQAALCIQHQYRIHASIRELDQIAADFEKLKKGFIYPHAIDFQKPGAGEGQHISVPAYRPPSDFDKGSEPEPEPASESEATAVEATLMDVDSDARKPELECKLDYTSTNYALNSYLEALDKLLMRLDGVESHGKKSIRVKRRGIVKDIEREAAKLERYWRQAWADYVEAHPAAIEQQLSNATESESAKHGGSPMETDDEQPKVSQTEKTTQESEVIHIKRSTDAESSNDDKPSSADDLGLGPDDIDEADFEWF